MTEMTVENIKDILETAAYVERLMPAVRPPKYRCSMPEIIYTPQVEEDPSVRWLLLQSAPLVVPYRPNATFCATIG